MMRDDAWKAYESWRRLWLSGGDNNAIAALRFHGLRGALAMPACNRTCPRPSPSSNNVKLPIADALIAEAASQVRRLLRVRWPPVIAGTVWEKEEKRHV